MNLNPITCSLLGIAVFVAALASCSAQGSGTPPVTPLEVPEKIMARRLDHVVAPKMPSGAIGKCSNAMVMLNITIDENGQVSSEEFLSGYDELKDSSLTAVRQWTYKPYEQRGHTLAVRTRVSIFYLGDGESFPVYSPNGKGGIKGGNMIPLPPGCGSGPVIKRTPN